MTIETRITPEMITEYTAKGYWGNLTIRDRFNERVRNHPHRTAVVDRERSITYEELDQISSRLALNFLGLGVKKDDIVCIQLPNSTTLSLTLFALVKIGAVIVAFPSLFRAKEVDYILKLTSSPAFVIPRKIKDFDYCHMVEDLRPDLPDLKQVIVAGEEVPPGTISLTEMIEKLPQKEYPPDYPETMDLDANDVFQLVMSAGTESQPKGCMWTHNTAHNILHPLGEVLKIAEDSVIFLAVPLSSGFGAGIGILANAMSGATLVLLDEFDPEEILRRMEKEKVTLFFGVSAQMISMLNLPDLDRYDLSSLECWISFGAPVPVAVAREARSKLGCQVIPGYGSSESTIIMPGRDDPFEAIIDTVGKPIGALEANIFDDEGRELKQGEVGEIWVRGPSLFVGYYKRPDLNRKTYNEEGWFFSGDLARVDENGNYIIEGRKKDMILRGGVNISALELEELLFTHPKILNATVVAMPDARMGEKACAYIVCRHGEEITMEEVVSFLRGEQLAVYKLPERIEVVNELPMTPAGKVQKRLLREDVAGKLEEEGN